MLLRTVRRSRRALWLVLVPVLLAGAPAGAAQASDPTFLRSTSALPPMPGGFVPSSSPDCTLDASPACAS
jgi:hypothetical protein